MDKVIHREKSLLQKISKVIGIISFIIAVSGMLLLIIAGSDLSDTYKASAGAATFFFFTVGIVLSTMGNANLPNLKISPTEKNNQ